MGVKPIGLSFKNTQEDMELYEWITSHSNMSGFIKDILKKEMRGETREFKNNTENENTDNSLIKFDF